MLSKIFIMLTCCFLVSSVAVANEKGPQLPLRTPNACEGEHCWGKAWQRHGKFTSNIPLHVFSKPLGNKIAYVIPAKKTFSVLAHDIYTLHTSPIKLTEADVKGCYDNRADQNSIKKGDIVYPLFYSGESYYQAWHNGIKLYCAWIPHLKDNLYQAQSWIQIYYNGKTGWWGEPIYCRGIKGARDKNCPRFNLVEPGKEK